MSSYDAIVVALVLLVVVLVVGAVTVALSSLAGRLDRMHIRLATADASLAGQLARRAADAQRLAVADVLDPASSVLLVGAAERVREARAVGSPYAAESALSSLLRDLLDGESLGIALDGLDAGRVGLITDLGESCVRVSYAHGFHDDLVSRTEAMRSRRVVRVLRLAGHAPWPHRVDLDAAPPPALAAYVGAAAGWHE